MATLRTKTIRYALDTRTTDLATDTTLGTATRWETASLTLDIPETGSRTFLSVVVHWTYRCMWAASNEVTGVRTGIKLGGAAFTDLDRSFTQAGAFTAVYDHWMHDVTSYFTTNFGAGATQTCQAAIAVSSTVAANINGNICAEVEITYQYDDEVGDVRVRTVPIEIGTHSTLLTGTQQEVGVDGTTPPPVNQIPILNTYLPEAGKVFKRAWIGIDVNDGFATSSVFVHFVQIDSAAEELRGGGRVVSMTGSMPIKDNFIYDTATYLPNVVHAFKMRSSVASRLTQAGATMWVTYTYTKTGTTRIKNVQEVPLVEAHGHWTGNAILSPDITTSRVLVAEVNITEPGTITLGQSSILAHLTGTSATNVNLAAGAQVERTYVPQNVSTNRQIHHRADHSSGWTVTNGLNRLTAKVRYSADTFRTRFKAIARVVYDSDVPAGGPEAGSRVCSFFVAAYGTATTQIRDVPASGGGQATIALDVNYSIGGVYTDLWCRATGGSLLDSLDLGVNVGEFDGAGLLGSYSEIRAPVTMASHHFRVLHTCFDRHWLTTGRLNPAGARRQVAYNVAISTTLYQWITRISFSATTYTVAGTIIINGVAAASGKSVQIWAFSAAGVAELVTTVTTTGGGGFTAKVPDNIRSYFASYDNDGNRGRSALATPV